MIVCRAVGDHQRTVTIQRERYAPVLRRSMAMKIGRQKQCKTLPTRDGLAPLAAQQILLPTQNLVNAHSMNTCDQEGHRGLGQMQPQRHQFLEAPGLGAEMHPLR